MTIHQLIGIALVVALILAVMPALGGAAADDADSLFPAAAVAVPNFISYRDRARLADATNSSAREPRSGPANKASPNQDECGDADAEADPTGAEYDWGMD